MTETSDAFGALLRRLRTDAGLTQEELAAAGRISVRTISDLERNVNQTARKDTARLLAGALNLTGPAVAAFEAVALGRIPASSFPAAGGPADRAAGARRTLPRDTVSFTGREAELEQLMAAAAQTSGAAVIHAIGGMAGVGKTTLAVHAAHQLASRFPDGQLFLPLHGHTPGQLPVDPENALAILLLTAGVPAAQIPPGLAARTALWRDRVAGQRLLLLLDDAVGSDQVRPLLPGSPGSLVLITSRRHLTALEDARSISLEVLPPDEAAQLLIRLAARPALSATDAAVPDAVPELTRLAGYLPLAIGMLARQLHHHPAWTPADLAADLSAERDRLSLLAAENLSVAAAFDLSYRDLSAGQQRMFRRLGLHLGPDIDAYAAAALDDMDLASARRLLTDLYDHYLLTEPVRGRYRLHDLIREHARALAAADPPDDRDGAIERLLSYYLATAQSADLHLALRRVAGPAWPFNSPARVPELVTGEQARTWMEAERLNLRAVFGHAVTHGPPGYVAAMSAAMNGFLRVQHWDEATALHQGAAEVARQAGDEYAEVEALTDLAHIQNLTADFAAATVNLTRAIEICDRIGYRPGEALARHELGVTERLTGHYRAAADQLNQALGLYRRVSDPDGTANTLYELGLVQYRTGDLKAATASQAEALETYRSIGHRRGEAWTLNILGVMQYEVGDYAAALVSLRHALEMQQRAGNRLGEANTTYEIGIVHRLTGNYAAAVAAQQRALRLYRDFGYHRGEANVLTALGTVHRLAGDYETAADHHRQALELYRAVSDRLGEGAVFRELGICQQLSGELREAGVSLARSLRLFRDLGEQINEGEVLNCLGDLALACARTGEARDHFTEALTITTSAATPPEEARAREGIGLCHLRDGDLPLAAEWLHRALEIYQRLGSPAAERVRQVLHEHQLGS